MLPTLVLTISHTPVLTSAASSSLVHYMERHLWVLVANRHAVSCSCATAQLENSQSASTSADTFPENCSEEFQTEQVKRAANSDQTGSFHRRADARRFHQAKKTYFCGSALVTLIFCSKSTTDTQEKVLTRRTSNAEWTRFTSLLFQITWFPMRTCQANMRKDGAPKT